LSDFLPLGDVCSLITKGTTPNAKLGGFSDSGVNYVKSESLSYSGGVDETKFVCISEATHQKLKRSILQERDILMSIAGANLGKVGMAKKHILPANTNQAVALIRVDPQKANPEFVQYYLRNPSFVANSLAGVAQSAQPNLNLGEISRFEIPNYLISEQQDIASTLGALDDKIELNRRMSATLEEMARALYRSWFVDFDPVHARAAGLSPAHMDPTTAALFPDSFGPDGLPKGWEAGCLGDIAKNVRQQVKPDKIDADTPYIGLEHMPRRSIALSEWGGAGQVGSAKSAMKKGQFLFGKLRPYFHKVGVVPTDGICSTDILVIDAKTDEWRELVLAIISSKSFVDHANASSSGTRMPRSNWKDMSRYDVAVPSGEIAKSFSDLVRPMTEKMVIGIQESRTLATLRDTLLPRLMSGELRIREAKKQIEEVA